MHDLFQCDSESPQMNSLLIFLADDGSVFEASLSCNDFVPEASAVGRVVRFYSLNKIKIFQTSFCSTENNFTHWLSFDVSICAVNDLSFNLDLKLLMVTSDGWELKLLLMVDSESCNPLNYC